MKLVLYTFLATIILMIGCRPRTESDNVGTGSAIYPVPSSLVMSNALSSMDVSFVFSNCTDNTLVLAANDIWLGQNLLLVAEDGLASIGEKYPLIEMFASPIKYDPELIVLEKGDTYWHQCHSSHGLMGADVPVDSLEENIYAVFWGWSPASRGNLEIEDFPVEYQPYVWRTVVTSMPIRVTFNHPLWEPPE